MVAHRFSQNRDQYQHVLQTAEAEELATYESQSICTKQCFFLKCSPKICIKVHFGEFTHTNAAKCHFGVCHCQTFCINQTRGRKTKSTVSPLLGNNGTKMYLCQALYNAAWMHQTFSLSISCHTVAHYLSLLLKSACNAIFEPGSNPHEGTSFCFSFSISKPIWPSQLT